MAKRRTNLGSLPRTHRLLAETAYRQTETSIKQGFQHLKDGRCSNAVNDLVHASAALRAARTETFHTGREDMAEKTELRAKYGRVERWLRVLHVKTHRRCVVK